MARAFKTRVVSIALAHGPAHDLAAGEVQNGGQVKPAFFGFDAGDVFDPDLVGCGGLGRLGQKVGRNGLIRLAVGARGNSDWLSIVFPKILLIINSVYCRATIGIYVRGNGCPERFFRFG